MRSVASSVIRDSAATSLLELSAWAVQGHHGRAVSLARVRFADNWRPCPGGVVALGPPVTTTDLAGRVAPGGVGLLVGPPRRALPLGFAESNQRAQRGRGLPLSIDPATGHVDSWSPAPSIPALAAEADGGVAVLEVRLPRRCFWSTDAAGIPAIVRHWPSWPLPPLADLRVSCLRWWSFGRDSLARRGSRWYSSRRVDGARHGRL
jgi:hypothetical protein